MLINLQRLDLNLIYSLACGDTKLNASQAIINLL